jgi:hypothetical protein
MPMQCQSHALSARLLHRRHALQHHHSAACLAHLVLRCAAWPNMRCNGVGDVGQAPVHRGQKLTRPRRPLLQRPLPCKIGLCVCVCLCLAAACYHDSRWERSSQWQGICHEDCRWPI